MPQPQHRDSTYAVQDAHTGLFYALGADSARLTRRKDASRFPATPAGRIEACARVVECLQPEAGYEVVRLDA